MDLTAIRQAVVDALNTLDGVQAEPEQPAHLPTGSGDQAVGLVLYPGDPYLGYHASFGGQGNGPSRGALCDVHLIVRAYVPTVDLLSAQRTLDQLASTGLGYDRSVFDALNLDTTLGGLVQTLKVERVSAYRVDPDQGMLLCDWTVTVWARR